MLRKPPLRWIAVFSLVLLHVVLVLAGGALPEILAPVIAATLYLPLSPFAAMGLPVFSRAESGGWPGPSVLGWITFGAFWSVLWALVIAVILRIRR
jgi:hypothetical protein